MSETVPHLVKVRIDWSEAETAQAPHANQALAQIGAPGSDGMPDGIYVTMGSVAPPPLLDDDEEARDRLLERLTTRGVKVNVVCQFHMSRQMLDDLIGVLQTTAAKYDAVRQSQQGPAREQGGGSA